MATLLKKFAANEDGATAIEYGIIAALMSVALIATLSLVGTNLSNDFNTVASSLR
ncbi:MAG TPA: Flp family type IVb pilin [Rhizomicrobium sp.]|nr:Flp family type IVb pilin [Rhizomicrobium sp.]